MEYPNNLTPALFVLLQIIRTLVAVQRDLSLQKENVKPSESDVCIPPRTSPKKNDFLVVSEVVVIGKVRSV